MGEVLEIQKGHQIRVKTTKRELIGFAALGQLHTRK